MKTSEWALGPENIPSARCETDGSIETVCEARGRSACQGKGIQGVRIDPVDVRAVACQAQHVSWNVRERGGPPVFGIRSESDILRRLDTD